MNGFKTPSPLRSPLAHARGRFASRSRPFSVQTRGNSHFTSPRSSDQEDGSSSRVTSSSQRETAVRGRGHSRGSTKSRCYRSDHTEKNKMRTRYLQTDDQPIQKETKGNFYAEKVIMIANRN